jgi:hypothetical protein
MLDCVKRTADAMHKQVALVRQGATAMDVDLNDFTDLDVLAILRWAETNTPQHLEASHTMIGVLATMRAGGEHDR